MRPITAPVSAVSPSAEPRPSAARVADWIPDQMAHLMAERVAHSLAKWMTICPSLS